MSEGIPDDIKKAVKNLAVKAKKEPQVLAKELKTLVETDTTIKAMRDESMQHKIRYAWALLYRKYAIVKGSMVYLKLTTSPDYRMVNKKDGSKSGRANICAIVKNIDVDENDKEIIGDAEIALGTFWDEAAEKVKGLNIDKAYKTSLKLKPVSIDVNGVKVIGNIIGGHVDEFEECKVEMPTNEEFYGEYFKPKEDSLLIHVSEMDLNVKKSQLDLRIINGRLVDYLVKEREDKSEFGFYKVADVDAADHITIFLNPKEMTLELGNKVKTVGLVSKFKDDIRWENFMMVFDGDGNEKPVARKLDIRPVGKAKKESVDVNENYEVADIAIKDPWEDAGV